MVNDDLLRDAAGHLTDRDRQIVRLIARHRVLTTSQLTRIYFANLTTARHRLSVLWQLRLLDRFRPLAPNQTAAGLHAGSYHYVLDEIGAWLVHVEDGHAPAAFRWRRRRQGDDIAYARSQQLTHQVEVNEFFTRLLARARHDPAVQLRAWHARQTDRDDDDREDTPEAVGLRPDGYGHWTDHDHEVRFWLEHDRGTEPLGTVADKLTRYGELAYDLVMGNQPTGIVLVTLPTARRERHLRQTLTDRQAPAATAVWRAVGAPDGRIWRPIGTPDDQAPLRLADLSHAALPHALVDGIRAERERIYGPHFTSDDDTDTYQPPSEHDKGWRD